MQFAFIVKNSIITEVSDTGDDFSIYLVLPVVVVVLQVVWVAWYEMIKKN